MNITLQNIERASEYPPLRGVCARGAIVILVWALLSAPLGAQPDRVSGPIDSRRTVVLAGQVPALARPQFDQGAVAPSLVLPAITLELKPSASQQTALEKLLANQQNPASPDFHKWLTPEQYADRFGLSPADVNQISAWLRSQGFTVKRVARSRIWIEFSGTARQVQDAFHTEIHQYLQNGAVHYANATNPSVPAALANVVLGMRGLNNFRLKPRNKLRGFAPRDTTGSGDHQMAPDDFATIYDVAPLYAVGIDGTGQKLVIVGQTDISASDIQAFRSAFNLPAINLQQVLVPNQTDPGVSPGDLAEADLDLEWSGAVARNATIIYLYSNNVVTSLQEAVDQVYAPVLSMSYGLCEGADLVDLPMYRALAQQANSEGITWLAPGGDEGAADCEDTDATIAQDGLAVDAPGSIPEVTSMGGTEFNEGSGNYWSNSNTANAASALSYIPEMVWNDTSRGAGLSAGGGGASSFFPQPVWQTGPGIPNNGFRNVPDLAIASSPDHDGYYVFTNGSTQIYGGTSFAVPTMAGIVALLNQYLVSNGSQKQPGLGNINPALYRIAQNSPGSGAFHDVTVGSNIVPCVTGSPDCTAGTLGFSAAPSYDQASGLGSPDAYNLIHHWTVDAPTASAVVPSIDQTPVFEQPVSSNSNYRWTFTIKLTEEAGVATTLTGFTMNGQSDNVATVFGTTSLAAYGSVSSTGLGLSTLTPPATVTFGFTGQDANGNQWTQTLAVPFEGPQTQLAIGGASNAASGQQSYAPGMLISVYGRSLGDFAQLAGSIPLPQYLAGFQATVNGVIAPLYYVSPDQVNLQIPYQTQPGTATLTITNPYISASYSFAVVPAAPGIFMSNGFTAAPFSSASRGQTTTLFITGDGLVSPSLATGDAPAYGTVLSALPKPNLPVAVTVAGQNATIDFIGIPSGLVGVTQINYEVPPSTPLGVQQVVVSVGGVASQAANLTVTQ